MSPAKPMTFKTEANARTHARKAKLNLDTLAFETNDDGKWFYYDRTATTDADPIAPPVEAEAPVTAEADADAEQFGPPAPRAMTSEDMVEIRVADSTDTYGLSRWDEAQDMGRMIADSEHLTIVLLDSDGVEHARFEPAALPVEDATPAEEPVDPSPDPSAPASVAPVPVPASDDDATEGVTHLPPSEFKNPPEPHLPALPDGTGYILRLRSKYAHTAAIMWAGIHSRALKVEIDVVHPDTGEVVAVGRPGSRSRAARKMGDASRRTTTTSATPAEPKAPRENADALAAKGEMPPKPSYASPSRQKYIPLLAELDAVIATGDVEKVRAFTKYAPKLAGGFRALEQYRQRVITAMEARMAAKVQEAA